jgi:hypothetical protein
MIEELQDQCNSPRGTSDSQFKRQVWQKLNEAYADVCGFYDWNVLKKTVTLADSVYIVPADCRSLLRVFDDDKLPYNMVAGHNRNSDFNKNWYFSDPIATPLAEGTTLAVDEYATALTSTTEFPATTCAGEYIRIGSNRGIYKISTWTSTSAMALVDHFRGDQVSAGIFQIRPRGTMVLAFCDAIGDSLEPTGVEVTYVRYPLPVYKDEDILELPGNCPAVRIRALQKLLAMLGFSTAAERLKNEYTAALSEMKASEPSLPIIQPTQMFRRNVNSRQGQAYIRGLSLINS